MSQQVHLGVSRNHPTHKLWPSNKVLKGMKGIMGFLRAVVYYYGDEACWGRADIAEAGGWKERLGKRELGGIRVSGLAMPCARRTKATKTTLGPMRDDVVPEGKCFAWTSGNSCSLSDQQNAIPSRSLDKASHTIYFLSAAVTEDDLKQDAHHRAKAVIDALYEAANLETRFDSRQEPI